MCGKDFLYDFKGGSLRSPPAAMRQPLRSLRSLAGAGGYGDHDERHEAEKPTGKVSL